MRPLALAPLLAAAVVLAVPQSAQADGFIVIRRTVPVRPRPMPRPLQGIFPLAVERHTVKVTIDGQVATTEVDQVFRNPLPRRLEGTYMFPLPADAAVDQFSMWIDGKEMQGELLDAKKALKIYTDIVRSMKDPALLEYAGRGMFKVRIFPIEPNSTKRVRLTYRQILKADAGRVRYRYPLNTEKFSSSPLKQCTVSVSIKDSTAIKGIYSPWHDVDVRRKGEKQAVASWEASNVTPSRDFVLDYDLAEGDVGMSLRTHALPAREGTFLLLISPKVEIAAAERVAKDVVFVFDTSGSMAADQKMDQARRALRYMIARLDTEDRFAVVDFATDARSYKDGLVSATAEEKAGATAYVDGLIARGGTATDDALARAMKLRAQGNTRAFSVVFMTDGQPTIGETDPKRILGFLKKRAPEEARIFVWGVGNEVNTHLLDTIAKSHKGDSYYVLPGEDIEVAMSSFYDKIASPVLTDLSLSFTGVRVRDVYPRQLPDLFAGSQLVVTGSFEGQGPGAIRLKGTVNGKATELVYEGNFRRHQKNPHVPRLWAKRKIGFLLDQIRLHGENAELRTEVVRLARRHGLPTPYTSYLVLEEGAQRRQLSSRGGRALPPGAPMDDADEAAEEAFSRLKKARKNDDGFSGPPSAKSGEGAVRGAREAGRLRRTESLSDGLAKGGKDAQAERKTREESIRTIGDRTFYQARGTWVDSTAGKRDKSWKALAYLSAEYFALLAEHPELGTYLALGKVIFRSGKVVYEIK